jgi:hypothetical protein
MDTSTLLWTMLFGSFGLGFFVFGKKQRAFVPLLCGIGLMVFPLFVSSIWVVVGIGITLMIIPFVFKP